jgi:mono/diheme cytochrome c family protein
MVQATMRMGVLALVVACGQADRMAPNSSGVMALSRDGAAVWVADADNGSVAMVPLQGGAVRSFPVGLNPTRLVQIGDRVLVTLRGERSVAELKVTDGVAELVRKVEVGAEPFGIVASADGAEVYVALSLEGAVVELDGASLVEQRRFAVPGEPRWLALNERAQVLYVGSRKGSELHTVSLRSGEADGQGFPEVERGVVTDGEEQLIVMTPRVTGEPTLSRDGRTLAVPVVYVDNYSTVGSADGTGPTLTGTTGVALPVSNPGYYASGPRYGLTRFNPAIVTYPVGMGGEPNEGGAQAMLVVGESDLGGQYTLAEARASVQQVTSFGAFDTASGSSNGRFTVVRSYLSALRFSDDGHLLYATLEGASSVLAIPSEPVTSGFPSRFGGGYDPFFGTSSFVTAPAFTVATGEGPTGLAFDGEGALLSYAFLDRTITKLPLDVMAAGVETQVLGETFGAIPSFRADSAFELEPSLLAPELQYGRRLFYSTANPAMSSEGAGVSCATCHADGRDDGLTWHFPSGPRQTPVLAGSVAHTAPYTWAEEVPTLEDEVMLTSEGRMLGSGIPSTGATAIAEFLSSLAPADSARKGALDEAAVRGRLVFEREDVGCATCHTGAALTDNLSYAMYGMKDVNTPSLVGIGASAPYLHDGSAATLAELIDGAEAGGMGLTRHLTAAERDDLVAYLSTL